MISFYPGPSRVHDEIPEYVTDAHKDGILSINHRSGEFMVISAKTIRLLKEKLEIPEAYTVFYTTSATECWEIIAQSLITEASCHLHNGAFGRKWFDYTRRLCGGAKSFPFGHNELIDVKSLPFDSDALICLTQNETSNGTQVSNGIIRAIRKRFPDQLIAVDATSSMAGIVLDFGAADIWFASVQKCFGLPAGLGLMVCSPAAMKRAAGIGEHNHYNSLVFMAEMMEKWQTPFTPNVLNIYLLMRVLEGARPIREVHVEIEARYRLWAEYFSKKETLRHFVSNEEARSYTVIPVEAEQALITAIKSTAKSRGILLGEGYGEWKSSTFRIANFPAITNSEIETLKEFLEDYA